MPLKFCRGIALRPLLYNIRGDRTGRPANLAPQFILLLTGECFCEPGDLQSQTKRLLVNQKIAVISNRPRSSACLLYLLCFINFLYLSGAHPQLPANFTTFSAPSFMPLAMVKFSPL